MLVIVNLKNTDKLKSELCFIQWAFLGHQAKEAASPATQRKLRGGGGGGRL